MTDKDYLGVVYSLGLIAVIAILLLIVFNLGRVFERKRNEAMDSVITEGSLYQYRDAKRRAIAISGCMVERDGKWIVLKIEEC